MSCFGQCHGGSVVKHIDEERLEVDLGYRFGYLAEFMGFGPDDIAAIHASAEHLGPRVGDLVDAVYVKLFAYDATKRHFTQSQEGYAGPLASNVESLKLTDEVIAFRKNHLARYLTALVTAPYDGKMVGYLDAVGKMHTPLAGNRQLEVPLVQMNALMGFVADALLQVISGLGLDRKTELRTLRAFNKLLWLQNDLISRHYLVAAAAGNEAITEEAAA